jgi:lactate dehydrogenase-like 2-hydroxyacid dehydrogenase
MTRTTILTMDSGHPGQIEALGEHFEVIRPNRPDPERIIRDHQHQIQGITTFLTPISKTLIEALPNLEIIATGAVGTDHIDLAAARGRSIAVTNTPDVLTDDTADVGMLLMLNVARRAVEGDAYVRAGLWKNGPLQLGTSLSGK